MKIEKKTYKFNSNCNKMECFGAKQDPILIKTAHKYDIEDDRAVLDPYNPQKIGKNLKKKKK